ncbi:MAG: IS200/IS605 family transposase [Syntrophorhabdaceae bacterium]|nr:IS200/IS605 family transposase [Syntrophorhabdaceae bacterium]
MRCTLDKGSHSVYNIQFHYVACVKYRRMIFADPIAARLKGINKDIAASFGIDIIEQEAAGDHIHILFSSRPQTQVSRFVNSLKSVSSRLLFRDFPELKKVLGKGHLWSPSYFASARSVKEHRCNKIY